MKTPYKHPSVPSRVHPFSGIFFKFIFRETGREGNREGEKQRNINRLPLSHLQLET